MLFCIKYLFIFVFITNTIGNVIEEESDTDMDLFNGRLIGDLMLGSDNRLEFFRRKRAIPSKKKAGDKKPSKKASNPKSKVSPKEKDSDTGATKATKKPQSIADNPTLKPEDLNFLEDIYKGKGSEAQSRKEMSDKIYENIGKKLKNTALLKAYLKNSHNISEGLDNASKVMENQDLGEFLKNWYKKKYKDKPLPKDDTEKPSGSDKAKDKNKVRRKKKKGSGKGKAKKTKNYSEMDEDTMEGDLDDEDDEGGGNQAYSKEELLKDLIEEHNRDAATTQADE